GPRGFAPASSTSGDPGAARRTPGCGADHVGTRRLARARENLMTLASPDPTRVAHPLEPLTADEVTAAVAILRRERRLGERVRFMTVTLQEPPKQAVLDLRPGDALERAAFAVLLDNADGRTYEAVVSLTAGAVTSWEHIPAVQPPITIDEFMECE